MHKCPKCGEVVDNTGSFDCPHCGKRVFIPTPEYNS